MLALGTFFYLFLRLFLLGARPYIFCCLLLLELFWVLGPVLLSVLSGSADPLILSRGSRGLLFSCALLS